MNCSVCEGWPISVGTSSYGVAFPIQVVEVYQTDAMTDPNSVFGPIVLGVCQKLCSAFQSLRQSPEGKSGPKCSLLCNSSFSQILARYSYSLTC